MSFPFVKQTDSMLCGAACLSMICRYYEKNISVGYLSRICSATNEEVSMLALNEAAIALGFHTVSARAEVKGKHPNLSTLLVLCIIFNFAA